MTSSRVISEFSFRVAEDCGVTFTKGYMYLNPQPLDGSVVYVVSFFYPDCLHTVVCSLYWESTYHESFPKIRKKGNILQYIESQ